MKWIVIPVIGAVTVWAAEVWNAKDYTQWTSDEIHKVLTDSPWAKSASVSFESQGLRGGGMGRRGGGGIGHGGGGYPGGGGIGFPGGGGYPGGGGGMGRGYPHGGGADDSGGGWGGSGSQTVLIRWDSASPVQHALQRNGEPVPAGKTGEKEYVISVIGWRMPAGDRHGHNKTDDTGDPSASGNKDPMRERLMNASQLLIKNRGGVSPDDVKVNLADGGNEVQFFFPAADLISLDDKEVTFQTHMGPMKLEKKFRLKDMTVDGKLEL